MSPYMTVLALSGIIPFVCSFYPPLKMYRNARPLGYTIGLIAVIFGLWDMFATFRGHWRFNPEGVWGIMVVNLPLEEVLFFIVIPFCCIFTWEAITCIRERRL